MYSDEQAIRSLIATWMEASGRGDLGRVLELMAEDVVFLGPGRPPMRGREAFVQEVRVFGDWAYTWAQLTVTIHPAAGGAPTRLEGPSLSVLRRTGGRWVIFRDANMITPAGDAPGATP
jgi:ketosteroid isomerase-like protein